MEELRHDEVDTPELDEVLPPTTPVPPEERRRGPVPRPALRFVGWFFLIAALVGLERVSMILVASEGLGPSVQLVGLAVFCTIVLSVTLFGGRWFASQFGK
jgi:hypothetical protein